MSPRLLDRDLSWLQFNQRVLDEARNPENPLLERAKFLSISSSNLDEFFMIRFSSAGRSTNRDEVLRQATQTRVAQTRILNETEREMKAQGIEILRASPEIFQGEILPKMSPPEAFTPAKLKLLGNLQMCAVFPKEGLWLAVPKGLPSAWTRELKGGGQEIFFRDDLLSEHLSKALNLSSPPVILRLTRDGDVALDLEEEDNESIPALVRSEITSREKGRPVRLQHVGPVPDDFLESCAQALKLDPAQIAPAPRTLCLHGLWSVLKDFPDRLKGDRKFFYPALDAKIPEILKAPPGNPETLFARIRENDVLLHHPYDSFDGIVGWIRNACEDPSVEGIQMTIYRTDALSEIVTHLKKVASHKRIRVVIELRARFDELNNLRLADELRSAGAQVVFGFGKLKIHAKIALVERREGDELKRYTHVSTGNYHAITARQYTDLAVLTARPEIGNDAHYFFESVAQGKVPQAFSTLVAAPTRLHRRLQTLIEGETRAAEAGKPARIFAKVNALVDATLIDALYRASSAGVRVDLVVRGACSLIPGIPGLSENIRVVSLIDRFLEHSRIYFFESAQAMYFSSADWMPRNFFSRLEVAYPVLDRRIYDYVIETLIPGYLGDTSRARELQPDGSWKRLRPRPGEEPLRIQFYLAELAKRQYQGTALE